MGRVLLVREAGMGIRGLNCVRIRMKVAGGPKEGHARQALQRLMSLNLTDRAKRRETRGEPDMSIETG